MTGGGRYVWLAGALAGALVLSANAQDVYSTSFENPPFGTGSLNGVDGWANGSGTGVSHSVVDSFSRTGDQSLSWDNSGANQSFYSVRRAFDGQAGAITPATPLEMSAWLYIDESSQPNRLYGLYGVNSGTGTLGGMTIGMTIGADGSVRAGTLWSQTYSGAPLATDPSLVGSWVKMVLSYDGTGGGARIYDSGLNEVFSTSFAAVNLSNANLGGVNSWNINIGTDYFATVDRAGIGYFDDVLVTVVPEPASILAFGAALALLRRRR